MVLLERYRRSEIELVVPDIFFAEFGNIIWKTTRLNRCDERTGGRAIRTILQEPFLVIPCVDVIWEAHLLGRAFDRSIYDCIYAAVAVKLKAQLVTADERLANAVGAKLPVVWIGFFSR